MGMGIMDAQYIESANTETFMGVQHQMAVLIFYNGPPYRYINGSASKIQENRVNWNIGDRLRLDFDLQGRRCTVFLNDQSLGSLTDDLPDTFFLAMSAHDDGTKLETTMFEIV